MSYIIYGSGILFAIFLFGVFLHVRRQRIKHSECTELDIPAFLRKDGADTRDVMLRISETDWNETSIHPWGKRYSTRIRR